MKRWWFLLSAIAVALSAAACTEHASTDATPDRHHNPTTTPVTPVKFTGIKHKLPTGKALHNNPDLYRTVTLNECTRDGAGWLATGTADNRTASTERFAVLVFFTDAEARTVDWARASVTVAPGEQGTWQASRQFVGNDIRCVVRAVARR